MPDSGEPSFVGANPRVRVHSPALAPDPDPRGVTVLDLHRSGTAWQLAGSLDAEGGRTLLREIEQAGADVRIDGSGLQRIDGAGLTALAVARQWCRSDGHTFAVTEVAPDALRELRIGTRLLELFGPTGPEDPDATHFHVRRHDGTAR